MARTKKTRKSNTKKKSTLSDTSTKLEIVENTEDAKPIPEKEKEIEDTNKVDPEMDIEMNGELDDIHNEESTLVEKNSDMEEEKQDDSISKKKAKKRVVSYPSEIEEDEKYRLFLKVYRDRGRVDSLIAETVKELKKQKNSMCVQLFALIFYLSDLKIQPKLKLNTSISSLTVADMILDSQENHLLPFAAFSKRSKSSFSYSVPFRRNAAFWAGIGRTFFEFREETSQRLIDLLVELTTFNHRNLRFVATSCILGILQGLAEIEQTSMDVIIPKKKKQTMHERLVSQCKEMRQQLYDQILCHRIRDVFAPIRVLVVVTIASLAANFPAIYNQDDYIKYIGLSLGDSDTTLRLEAVRCLITLVDKHYNDDIRDLLKRYKQRILFMSRDQQSIIIIAIIRLVDLMREKKLISEEEDDLIFELAVDADRSIANRAFEYLSKYNLQLSLSKTDKKLKIPEKSVVLLRVVHYLEKYATDESETNHVYFFVKNCAGNTNALITDANKNVLNVEEMVHLLINQRNSYGLTTRQLCLLSVLLKATVQLFYDNHDSDIQSASYNQYSAVNEAVIPRLEELLKVYKADPLIEVHLINMTEFLSFPSLQAVDSIAAILIDLFKAEQDSSQANHVLYILSHLNVTWDHPVEEDGQELVENGGDRKESEKGNDRKDSQSTNSTRNKDSLSEAIPIQTLLHSTCEETMELWTSFYKEVSGKLLVLEKEKDFQQIEEQCRSMCVTLSRLINLLCYSDECTFLQEKGLFTDIEMLLLDIKNTDMRPVLVELRYDCKRLKQLRLLYQYYALKSLSSSPPSYTMEDVRADTHLLLDSIQADMKVLIPYAETHQQHLHSILQQYLTCVCDLLIVAEDSLLDETITQSVGDVARVLLIGSHDADLSSDEDSLSAIAQQKITKQVLTPLYQVSLAHITTIFPSCLFYFLTHYGSLSYELCKELFKASKNVNVKIVHRIILDSLQYAFSNYKLNKQIVLDTQHNQKVAYEQFVSNSKKLASLLGVQLPYDSLVALFDIMKEAIQIVTSADNSEMIEFLEGLIPFVSKLTKEAKDLLVVELEKSVESMQDPLKDMIRKQFNEEGEESTENSSKEIIVFRSLLDSLKKERGKKPLEKKEKEKEELKAIAPKAKKRSKPDTKSTESKPKKNRKK